jgi:hypothetical protein
LSSSRKARFPLIAGKVFPPARNADGHTRRFALGLATPDLLGRVTAGQSAAAIEVAIERTLYEERYG